jgi:hypothetical protein
MKISNKYKNSYFFDKLTQEEETINKIENIKNKLKSRKKIKINYTNKIVENFKNKQEKIQ